MSEIKNEYLLDNSAWVALSSDQAHLGLGNDLAKRYFPDVWQLIVLPDYQPANFKALEEIVAIEEIVFGGDFPQSAFPPNWQVLETVTILQMVGPQSIDQPTTNIEPSLLTAQDLPDIMALINLTHPGPFESRTLEMGAYWGIFEANRLIAMGGERMSVANFCEISAVCTHPDYQGRGYARFLVCHLMQNMFERGQIPFLHVVSTNTNAIALYKSLGFTTRLEFPFYVFKRLA